jgi:hypothetical protein
MPSTHVWPGVHVGPGGRLPLPSSPASSPLLLPASSPGGGFVVSSP